MRNRAFHVSLVLMWTAALPGLAAAEVEPVRMGCGAMTFDTVPGWGLGSRRQIRAGFDTWSRGD